MTAEIKKIEDIIESSFEMPKYVALMNEIFPSAKLAAPYKKVEEFTNFSSHIAAHYHVADYCTSDKKHVVILAVELKKDFFVENSRSTQRSYARKLIENSQSDAALIAYFTSGNPRWRLSFVRVGYEMKFEENKLKAVEKITPARRYSFLVGEDEPSHTAIERLLSLAGSSAGLTLDELEEAFSVEKVTKEFFELYCEKYHQLYEYLLHSPDFLAESEKCNFTAEQFAKKLMGQIVFLYFLQKKGWLGVRTWPQRLTQQEYKDVYYAKGAVGKQIQEYLPIVYKPDGNEYVRQLFALDQIPDDVEEAIANSIPRSKQDAWGQGSKRFLRTVFDYAVRRNTNFYNEYLEPLFYDTLNRNRGQRAYCPLLHCRVPFLSGGLFEPLKGYDWKHSNLNIPNEMFSDLQGTGSTGDGILDIFDRYNFTMSEDEPLEREVAIDPEMLGKVFESLLDISERKNKGAFYTPREIVHYMCQESLINYLVGSTGLSEEGIRDFILYGDFMKDEDTVKEKRLGNSGMYISEDIFKIDSEGHIAVNCLKDVDDALADIRVCDPAVGSGAFPVGMLNEIVRARQNLTEYMVVAEKIAAKSDAQANYQARKLRTDRSAYSLKRKTIKNCIYAVDIEPSAVDIAQLRLWLSLVIDDEINPEASGPLEGHSNPTPLPNLECNILCGNSLVDRFEGKPLLNFSDKIGRGGDNEQADYSWYQFQDMLPKLFDVQEKIFSCDEPNKKVLYLAELADIKREIIRQQLYGITDEQWQRFLQTEDLVSKPYILWQLDFSKVFTDKGGFDVVIGNPPYIQLQKQTGGSGGEKFGDLYIDEKFETFERTGDIYCLFYEKGLQLLRKGGILTYITSNKWMRAGYGKKLRGYLSKYNPVLILDFAGQKIFETATVDVNILLEGKTGNKYETMTCIGKEGCRENLSEFVKQHHNTQSFSSADGWIIHSPIEQSINDKITAIGIPLKKWNIDINYGIKTGCNDAFIISGEKRSELIREDPNSAEIIRPILRGQDIKRYNYTCADLWLINTHNGIKEKQLAPIDIENYPAVKKHLDKYYLKLEHRADKGVTPYNLRNCAYMDDFSKQKIAWARLTRISKKDFSDFPRFALIPEGYYVVDSLCFFSGDNLDTLIKLLNSKYAAYYFFNNVAILDNGGLQMRQQYVENIPLPKISLIESNDEKVIDQIIFNAFDFSKEEIACIDSFIERKKQEIGAITLNSKGIT